MISLSLPSLRTAPNFRPPTRLGNHPSGVVSPDDEMFILHGAPVTLAPLPRIIYAGTAQAKDTFRFVVAPVRKA
ncbi:hypothetical protein CTA1_7570 [Colletotrichum tanaceti]|uniref:Uncharacterized protein n=1 Tax=Colletotrichum tanaceti TaxID=1306861 RepID=A0A4U6XR95_9PEZI|nr:hypothetical protein CTA1_7570 [Colletotrichum tanaceti]